MLDEHSTQRPFRRPAECHHRGRSRQDAHHWNRPQPRTHGAAGHRMRESETSQRTYNGPTSVCFETKRHRSSIPRRPSQVECLQRRSNPRKAPRSGPLPWTTTCISRLSGVLSVLFSRTTVDSPCSAKRLGPAIDFGSPVTSEAGEPVACIKRVTQLTQINSQPLEKQQHLRGRLPAGVPAGPGRPNRPSGAYGGFCPCAGPTTQLARAFRPD
jgi:hypothetical protein